MPDMNPYNFVRLRDMAEGARRPPLGHKQWVTEHEGQPVFSGRLKGVVTTFGPMMILSHADGDVSEQGEHKHFQRFFHYPNDERPVIPGSSLKGMVRAVAEAASNSCFSVLNETYVKRWDDFANAYPPSLRFCGHSETPDAETTANEAKRFCPTCRIFGTAAEEGAGTSQIGAVPRAFQGKVRFSDAIFQEDLTDIYAEPARLIILSGPKVSERVWYHNPDRGSREHPLAGRKFYYHHDDLRPATDESDKRLNQRATVTPLKPGATFIFQLDFRNLLQSELDLLLYALELEPAPALVRVEQAGQIAFEWQKVKEHQGVYPKLGYGKPAGLGSVCLLVTEMTLLEGAATRYGGQGNGWQKPLTGQTLRQAVEEEKKRFRFTQRYVKGKKYYWQPYLADLRKILRFPNGIKTFRYPELKEFTTYKTDGIKLPRPGDEHKWEAGQ
jgi:hypothetical protein